MRLLAPVLDDLVFVGGCATGLFITDPAAAGIRPTVDVDAIVDVASYAGYAAFADRLRALGLGEDMSPGAPMYRWRRDGVVVDVMPVDERIWASATAGIRRPWRRHARLTSPSTESGSSPGRHSCALRGNKLDAFRGRGRGDVLGSHDSEDIATVFDGRAELPGEIAESPAEVRDYIAAELRALLDNADVLAALSAFLPPDAASQRRRRALEARLRNIASV